MVDRYPNTPGHRGVDTSIEAMEVVAGAAGRLQRLALREIGAAGPVGLTTDELARRLNLARPTIQPRSSELRRKGLIRDSGLRRRNASGVNAIVWVATS
jgi:DNA-binding IclR family transcriptional regulator